MEEAEKIQAEVIKLLEEKDYQPDEQEFLQELSLIDDPFMVVNMWHMREHILKKEI